MDPADLLPPPAYSEQEFDQKIMLATAVSLNANIDVDGWPQYDPADFQGPEGSNSSPIAVEHSMGTSSGKKNDYMQHAIIKDLPSVVPLRIEKKNQQKSKLPTIPQPTDESDSLTISENPTPTLFYPGTTDHRSQFQSAAEDALPTAPPSHSTQNASLPSMPLPPPFEVQLSTCPSESTQPLDYDEQHFDPYNVIPSQSGPRSPLIQSRSRFLPQEGPKTSYPPYVSPLDFNPSIAYGKTQPVASSPPLEQPVKNVQYDPYALYNSAVSAQMTQNVNGQRGHLSYPSYNSRSSFSLQRQYQRHGLPATYLRPGHDAQSFASHDPLSIEGSSAPLEMNNSTRQSVLQPPARPTSSYSMSSDYQTFNPSPSSVYQYVSHTANMPGAENRWSTSQ